MSTCREFSEEFSGDLVVRGFLHVPNSVSGSGIILTHGAGANCRSPLLTALANEFCDHGIPVLRYDLPFRQARPHGPPIRGSAARDQNGIERAVESMRKVVAGKIFAGGHSYGGRQTSMVAAASSGLVDGLLLLSYPLHPPQRPAEMRTTHFTELRTPALFVHGSRDGFGSFEEMTAALALIPATTQLLQVTGAGHELLTKKNQEELPKQIAAEFHKIFT